MATKRRLIVVLIVIAVVTFCYVSIAQSIHLIKANTQSGIYHTVGCQSYPITEVNKEEGDEWFSTEEQAVAAGFRKAKNCP